MMRFNDIDASVRAEFDKPLPDPVTVILETGYRMRSWRQGIEVEGCTRAEAQQRYDDAVRDRHAG